ncbi:hypothetical protein ABBQ38_008134 [Trebouxia sp. C0009 RCD-2024]
MAEDEMWVELRPAAQEFLEKLAEVGQIIVFMRGVGASTQGRPSSNSSTLWLSACLSKSQLKLTTYLR